MSKYVPQAPLPSTVTKDDLQTAADSLATYLRANCSQEDIDAAVAEFAVPEWPKEYRNRTTGKVYKPHGPHEATALLDTPRHILIKGGEGSGKSVCGIVKTLDRLRAGASGLMASPDLPHFKRSLWPEFQRWCPWEQVIEKHRNRGHIGWEPYQPFYLVFQNDAVLFCGGMDEPGAWEGPNVNFAFFDEARRKKKADALKVLTGRIRIPGPDETPPQIWITTTPRKHWLYEFFGGLAMVCQDCQFTSLISIQEGEEVRCKECGSTNLVADDPYETFKRHSKVITLFTKDNEPNLQEDFAAHRAQTLTEKEARVLLEAAWEDFEDGQPFLPSMTWWNDCREDLPPLANREPMVVGMDAAIGRTSGISDCFAIVGVTRHPSHRPNTVAVRYVKSWQAKSGGQIDFQGTDASPGPERELRHLCANYNVKVVVYDPYQLHDMATRLSRERIVWMKPFGQTNLRPKSDSDLLRLVLEKRIAHDGDALLTRHLANADRKVDPEGKRLKLVKREDTGKIDLAVALSMASYEALRLNL